MCTCVCVRVHVQLFFVVFFPSFRYIHIGKTHTWRFDGRGEKSTAIRGKRGDATKGKRSNVQGQRSARRASFPPSWLGYGVSVCVSFRGLCVYVPRAPFVNGVSAARGAALALPVKTVSVCPRARARRPLDIAAEKVRGV